MLVMLSQRYLSASAGLFIFVVLLVLPSEHLAEDFSMYSLQGPESSSFQAKNHYKNLCVTFKQDGEAVFAKFDSKHSQLLPLKVSVVFHEFAGNWQKAGKTIQPPGGWSSWFSSTTNTTGTECCTWLNKTAFMVPVVVLGNLWHTLWHTIPAYTRFVEFSLSDMQLSKLDVLALPAQPLSTYNSLRSVGWQLFLFSIGLSGDDISNQISRQSSYLSGNTFVCYHHAFVVGHDKFSLAQIASGELPKIELFRLAVHRQMQLPQTIHSMGRVQVLLRKMRGHGRVMLNEQELRRSLLHLTMVDFAIFEYMPFHEQLKRVLASTGLCGVHGAGLSWAVLMHHGFLVEILPTGYTAPTRNVYASVARALHLAYDRLEVPCENYKCDIVVNTSHVAMAIGRLYGQDI